jgi:hypothetical protein
MTPAERLAHGRTPTAGGLFQEETPASAAAAAIAKRLYQQRGVQLDVGPKASPPSAPAQPKKPRPRSAQFAETAWYQYLLYPLRAGLIVGGLAAVFTVLSGGAILLLPNLFELRAQPGMLVVHVWLLIVAAFPVVGYVCAFLGCTLTAAAAGQFQYIHWPRRDLGLVSRSAGTWLVCFLAGPVLPAVVGVLFWLQCGEPTILDRLILTELGTVALSYWLFALLAVYQSGRVRDANPLHVADMVHELGYGALTVVVAGSALLVGHALVAFAALGDLQQNPEQAWLWLAGSWGSGLYCATALFRLLGIWSYRQTDRARKLASRAG